MSTNHRVSKPLALLAALLLCQAANAGPPLICHPFVTGTEPLLPWVENVNNWFSPDRHYDVANLTADTLKLLTPDAPVLTRMENLRRATLYASLDPRVAIEFLTAVVARVDEKGETRAAAMASFDAAYLIETYRQLAHAGKADLLAEFESRAAPAAVAKVAKLDTHALVREAQTLAPELTAELEFATSLMSSNNKDFERHRALAAELTPAGSLLAKNLEHWN